MREDQGQGLLSHQYLTQLHISPPPHTPHPLLQPSPALITWLDALILLFPEENPASFMPNLSSVFPELLDGKKDVREKKTRFAFTGQTTVWQTAHFWLTFRVPLQGGLITCSTVKCLKKRKVAAHWTFQLESFNWDQPRRLWLSPGRLLISCYQTDVIGSVHCDPEHRRNILGKEAEHRWSASSPPLF